MEQLYKKNYIKYKSISDLEFQIIEWHYQDEIKQDEIEVDEDEDESCKDYLGKYTIRCFGVTQEGVSIVCEINEFKPFFYIKVNDSFNKRNLKDFINFIKTSYSILNYKIEADTYSLSASILEKECIIVEKKDIFGYKGNIKNRFVKLVFKNIVSMNKTKYLFKHPVIIFNINNNPIKYELYESFFEPFMRFCHIKDINMAGWIKLPRNKYENVNNNLNTTHLQVKIHYNDIISLKDRKTISNFLQASWDIETYSFDGSFPDPNSKIIKDDTFEYPNVIYQIATTFKYYSDENTLIKHLLTLKKCEKIDDDKVIIQECKDEKDLIINWINLIKNMDPDIMYTYNGDTFDCMYLYERCKLHGLQDYIRVNLSRLSSLPVNVKKEEFSSSAYGDSDFLRFYIPGRLNYDLLIHYKRGMKKYPSYKLDYIANEILKQGKHDVSAKDIFSYYKDGSPDKISVIAKYCIQDTELLQLLVDKQLILITIIQLANVTYVPIGFLTTRGQTIKVFSQLLRKARQMGYIVPHVNFNKDNYALHVYVKDHTINTEHIGDYIKITCGKNKNLYNKFVEINGKISEIIDQDNFIVMSNIELLEIEKYTATFSYKYIKNKRIACLSSYDEALDTSFTGATVLNAEAGMYTDNIAVLDFASLYPTIMISRNLCYSTFIINPKFIPQDLPKEEGIYNINNTIYERIKWDDTIEYTLNHKCESKIKSGKSKDELCNKQAYFEITKQEELDNIITELNELNLNVKKNKTKINTKQKQLDLIKNKQLDVNYFCRIHDPFKSIRSSEEKYQKKNVHYDYVIVQPHDEINSDGKSIKINQGVLPALLEELYAERKKVKKEMSIANKNGDKLLEDILNSTQLAIKISLNSCYGFLGRGQGNLILKELGSIVTSVGRKLINKSKNYSEGQFLEYIKNNNLLTQKIKYKKELIQHISQDEKNIILSQFKSNTLF